MLSRFSWKKNLCDFVHFSSAKNRFKIEQEKKEASLANKLFHSLDESSCSLPACLGAKHFFFLTNSSCCFLHFSFSKCTSWISRCSTYNSFVYFNPSYELAFVLNTTKFWTWNTKLQNLTPLFLLPIFSLIVSFPWIMVGVMSSFFIIYSSVISEKCNREIKG